MNVKFYLLYLYQVLRTDNVDPGQMLQNTALDLGLHCSPLIQQFLDISTWSKMDLYKYYDKYGKEIRCLNPYPAE